MARIYVPKPYNPVIDWTNPITKGLQMDWILSEGGGLTPRDLVTRQKLAVTNNDWVRQFGEVGLRFDASGEYTRLTPVPPRQQFTRFLTVEVEFTRDSGGSGTSYSVLTGLYKGTAFSDRIWHIENDNGSGGWGLIFQIWWNSQPGIWSIPYPATGEKHHWVITYDGGSTSNNPVFVLNGKLQTAQRRLDPAGSLRTGGTHFYIGNNNEHNGAWDGNAYRVRTWDTMKSIRQMTELYRNPWQIYQKSPLYMKAPAAAPVSSTYVNSYYGGGGYF